MHLSDLINHFTNISYLFVDASSLCTSFHYLFSEFVPLYLSPRRSPTLRMNQPQVQAQKHRDACDACHYRKIRCPFAGPGACSNCQSSGRVCVFSPRDEMGRPKKCAPKKGARKRSTTKNSPPKKQEEPEIPIQPIQPIEDNKTLPNAPAKEEGTIPVEGVDLSFPDEWQDFLSFPVDEKDIVLYA